MIRTRFAPSPTGYVHLGNLRTALFAYLFARHEAGVFILRVEDTDQSRYVEGAVENLLRTLEWAGITLDEGPYLDANGKLAEKGQFGPYTQSKRLSIYQKYVAELIAKGGAYHCFCTAERLENLRTEQQLNKLPTGYDGLCLKTTSPEEAAKRIEQGEKYVVRLKMPRSGETIFTDLIRGEVRFKNELIDDQVLLKSDGFPTYHLAVVVDDHLMEISHVIRGEDWISSTPKHIQLYRYFGWEIPEFGHVPLILNSDKSKFSKRQGDVAAEQYQSRGYLPEALVNFIAFLGWNPGDERELFNPEELCAEFKLDHVSKAGAVFNLEKLDWFNREYLKRMNPGELVRRAKPFLATTYIPLDNEMLLTKAVALEQTRITTLSELGPAINFVFQLPEYPPTALVWRKSTSEQSLKILTELIPLLNTISVQDWQTVLIEARIKAWIGEQGYNNGEVLWPLRVALSGQEKSPPPFEIAAVLGQQESIHRVETALAKLQG